MTTTAASSTISPTAVVLIVGLGTFLTYLDATLVNALFPAILAEFGEDLRTTSWVINATNLGMATGLIVGGRVADTHGRRRVFLQALVAYAIAATLCGMASTLWVLMAARVALGVCMALLLTSSLALLSEAVPPARRAAAIGLYAAVGGIGTILGPLIGALVVGHLTWRWAYLLNVPICLAGVAFGLRLPGAQPAPGPPVSWPMGVVTGVASASLLFVISNAPETDVASAQNLTALSLAVLAGGCVFIAEARSSAPLFPRRLRNAGFTLPLLGGMALGFAFGVCLFSVPIFVTQVAGRSFAEGSMALAPTAVISVAAAVLGGLLAQRIGYRFASGCGLLLATGWLGLPVFLGVGSTSTTVLAVSAVGGIGLGVALPSMAGLALQEAGDADAGVGMGWYNTARVLGIALGVTVFALVFSHRVAGPTSGGRDWLATQMGTIASADDRARVLTAFDRVRACVSPSCRREGLATLGALERISPAIAEGLRRDFAVAFRSATLACGVIGAALLVPWLVLAQRGRRS